MSLLASRRLESLLPPREPPLGPPLPPSREPPLENEPREEPDLPWPSEPKRPPLPLPSSACGVKRTLLGRSSGLISIFICSILLSDTFSSMPTRLDWSKNTKDIASPFFPILPVLPILCT